MSLPRVLGNTGTEEIVFRERGYCQFIFKECQGTPDQGNTNLLSIIISCTYEQKVKQANKNGGKNDKHFWGSTQQRKSFWDQSNLSLKQFREQVVSLTMIK